MRVTTTIVSVMLVALLSGCAGMQLEARGFSPEATARIMSAFEAMKSFCADGVAGESRSAQVYVQSGDHARFYNAHDRVETYAGGRVECNP